MFGEKPFFCLQKKHDINTALKQAFSFYQTDINKYNELIIDVTIEITREHNNPNGVQFTEEELIDLASEFDLTTDNTLFQELIDIVAIPSQFITDDVILIQD